MGEHRWLAIRIRAPLVAFGGVMIDHVGNTRDFPSLSMLTGLIANAFGFRRGEGSKLQAVQDRIVFASCWLDDSDTDVMTDVQNARLEKSDRGWTTRGAPEGRDGDSYGAPHRRQREFLQDVHALVVARFLTEESPTLEDVAQALDRPARPLFIGRKPCLPTCRLNDGFVAAPDAYQALLRAAKAAGSKVDGLRALWPVGHGPTSGSHVHAAMDLPDLRNWRSGLHGGSRGVIYGKLSSAGGHP